MKPFRFEWEPLGERQLELRRLIGERSVVFAYGAAGTGKTLVTTYCAFDALDRGVKNGGVRKVIVTRPLINAGQSFGYLPGDVAEKTSPYLAAVYEIIKDSNHPQTQTFIDPSNPLVVGIPVELMRGQTFHDAFVIVDESQNLTRNQFEMLLTRIGNNCTMVFTGDPSQCDLRKPFESGLLHAINLLKNDPQVGIVEFGIDDVKRSDLVGRVIRYYAADRASHE